RIPDFSRNGCSALQLPVRLAHDQNVVIWLHGYFCIRPGRGWKARRAQILSVRPTLEEVAGVERDSEGAGRNATGSIRGEAGDFRLVELRALLEAARQQYEIDHRHS